MTLQKKMPRRMFGTGQENVSLME